MERQRGTRNSRDRGRPNEFVTVPEAARRTGIGLRQFKRAIDDGEIALFEFGSWPRVRWADVLGWIERQRVRRSANNDSNRVRKVREEAAT